MDILQELWVAQVESLSNILGTKQTLDLLTPFFERMGDSGTLQLMKNMGVNGKEIQDVAKIHSVMVPPNVVALKTTNVHEDGLHYIIEGDCPFKDAPREICILHDQATTKGSLEAFGLEGIYEFVMDFDHPRTYCKSENYLTKKGQGPPTGKILCSYSTEDLRARHGQDWFDDLSIQYKAEFVVQTTNMAIEELGAESAKSVLLKAAKQVGGRIGARWRNEGTLNDFSVTGIKDLVEFLGQAMKQDSLIKECGEKEWTREVRSCPFSYSSQVLCAQLETLVSQLCFELFPGSSYEMSEMITRGDPLCLGRIITSNPGQQSTTPYNEHLKALKLRLAKGEITEQDYFRLKKLILEDE